MRTDIAAAEGGKRKESFSNNKKMGGQNIVTELGGNVSEYFHSSVTEAANGGKFEYSI